MKNYNSATLESRIRNNAELIAQVRTFSKYNPTSDELKADNYQTFINEANDALTNYKRAAAALKMSKEDANIIFSDITNTSRGVRNEIVEVKGKDSAEWRQVTSIVSLITGENVLKHSKMKKEALKNIKEGETPVFFSVSQTDNKSKLGNFRSLVELLKEFGDYTPEDNLLSIESLTAMISNAESALSNTADKDTLFFTERTRIAKLFDQKNGLRNRAVRAKNHVKRQYGVGSDEYRSLTRKRY